ncbi:MAG: TniQ family protein [Propionivibrio sp.]|nr:TniQ family protein [Propionivibrio sp.]
MTDSAKRSLRVLPSPAEDEILDSVISRYHLLSGNHSARETMIELLGSGCEDIPKFVLGGLDHLCSAVSACLLGQPEDIVQNRTLLPVYALLLQPFQTSRLVSMARPSQRIGAHVPVLYRGRKVMAADFRLCPCCVEEELSELGFAYWHRSHQLIGSNTCHIHGCDLISHCRSCGDALRNRRQFSLPRSNCTSCKKRHLPAFSYPDAVRRLARLAREALDLPIRPRDPLLVAAAMQARNQALVTNGRGRSAMVQEYSMSYLNNECSIRLNSEKLDYLKHVPREKDPLYIYEIGSFARFADLLVSVDTLFGSWSAFETETSRCPINSEQHLDHAAINPRSARQEKTITTATHFHISASSVSGITQARVIQNELTPSVQRETVAIA